MPRKAKTNKGKAKVECQYCRRTLPEKLCKRHQQPEVEPFTEERAEEWFLSLPQTHFAYMSQKWNERNYQVEIPNLDNYDDWLNYFKTLSPTTIQQLARSGVDFLTTEAYAALSRWHDIIKSPHRIEKIHQSGLSRKQDQNADDIISLAKANDRMGVLCAVRDEIALKLARGAGARDTASLAREMGDILDQIAELQKRSGPGRNTKLGQLLSTEEPVIPKPRTKGKGARNVTYKSKITIDDME